MFDDIRDNPSPVYKKLYQFLNVKHIQQSYEKEHVSANTSKLNVSIREKLKKYFEKDVKELEKIIQRKINWFY